MQQKLTINLQERSYPIFIGTDMLKDIGSLIRLQIPTVRRSFVITNTTVEKLYGQVIMNSLSTAGLEPAIAAIPDGEEYKTLETASSLYDKLIQHQMDRSSVVLSLGGGVVGDLAGFVAATFMRGVDFVQIPTTLLAQVDSSIGGKVAVNHQAGKNLIGAFYQPKLVLIDIDTLRTLSEKEITAGMAEVVKYGMVFDEEFFSWIETSAAGIKKQEPEVLIQMIYQSCVIKGKVVETDEREENLRAILNFGHTVGHALENLTHYVRYRHGEAVAIGMVQASRFAILMGIISREAVQRLIKILKVLGLPTELPPDLSSREIIQTMRKDKKSYQGKVKLILPTAIGRIEIVDHWDEEKLSRVLDQANCQ